VSKVVSLESIKTTVPIEKNKILLKAEAGDSKRIN